MYIAIITSFFILCAVVFINTKRADHIEAHQLDEFWERERRANFIRRKPLDGLPYITIPDEILHMEPACADEEIKSCLADLNDIASDKIVNLTGYTNTDLKLEYGTANITILSEFDFHYTNMVTLLQKLAELLHEAGDDNDAVRVLEFAVSTGTDVSKSYYLLADLYYAQGTPEKIDSLIEQAGNLRSLMKDTIIQNLRELV